MPNKTNKPVVLRVARDLFDHIKWKYGPGEDSRGEFKARFTAPGGAIGGMQGGDASRGIGREAAAATNKAGPMLGHLPTQSMVLEGRRTTSPEWLPQKSLADTRAGRNVGAPPGSPSTITGLAARQNAYHEGREPAYAARTPKEAPRRAPQLQTGREGDARLQPIQSRRGPIEPPPSADEIYRRQGDAMRGGDAGEFERWVRENDDVRRRYPQVPNMNPDEDRDVDWADVFERWSQYADHYQRRYNKSDSAADRRFYGEQLQAWRDLAARAREAARAFNEQQGDSEAREAERLRRY